MNIQTSHDFSVSDLAISRALEREDWMTAKSVALDVVARTRKAIAESIEAQGGAEKIAQERLAAIKSPVRPIHKILYLPVEVKCREFEVKLELGRAAAAAGFHVVIGWSWALLAKYWRGWPPGLVLNKTMHLADTTFIAAAVNAGHRVAVLDEEVFASVMGPDEIGPYADPAACAAADIIFAQSEAYRDGLVQAHGEKIDGLYEKIIVSGSPRADRLRRLRDAPRDDNDFSIVFTMQGILNNIRRFSAGVQSDLQFASIGWLDCAAERLIEHIEREIQNFPLTVERIKSLAAAGRYVIVRPHPSEEPQLWKTLFEDFPTVVVTGDGNAPDLLFAGDDLHTVAGCSCTAEAQLLGREPKIIGDPIKFPAAVFDSGEAMPKIVAAFADLADRHSAGPIDPELIIGRKSGFSSSAFQRHKFPITECPPDAYQIEKNVFLISPGKAQ